MKTKLITMMFLAVSSISFAQNNFKKVYKYDDYNKDWALVKNISNTYGFIDRNGIVVVEPIYTKIEKFNENFGKYAMVKTVSGTYGFIDRNGKLAIKTLYWNKHDATEQLKKLKN